MATSTFLASTLLMGGIGFAVAVGLARSRPWERYSPQVAGRGSPSIAATDSRIWIAGFVVLAVLASLSTPALLTGSGDAAVLIFAAAGLVITGFLAAGSYAVVRSRGRPHSHAVATALGLIGGMVTLALVVNLATQFGA